MPHRPSYSTKIAALYVSWIECRFSENVRCGTDAVRTVSIKSRSSKRNKGMGQTDTDRIMELCRLICEEHNPSRFQKLVMELNQLLLQKERTLANPPG